MHRTLILIYVFIWLTSCSQLPTAEKPLPEKEKALQVFPMDIQGNYLNSEDNSILTISDHSIIKTYDFDIKILKDSIDHIYYIRNDTMFDRYSGEIQKIKLSGDTIIQKVHKTIMLFKISDDNVLKKHKGHYFLNSRFSESDWIISVLSVRKGIMSVQGLHEIDIEKLEDLTNTNADTTSFDISLIKKTLDHAYIQNGIGRSNYLRLRNNGR